ncbi:hypothetical protein [Mycobacterium genavense]|uniref:hypothetical protein n=1 Tax=Mycobacterium genavense TaxID=36812 RepID=UPI0004AE8357|nr:hypothetical protein [Mycobacterium genavense]
MAAWTSLYDASNSPPGVAAETRPAAVATPALDPAADPLLDSLLAEDPGLLAGDPGPAESAPAPAPPSALPGIPNFGMSSAPAPGSMGGWGTPGGLAIPERREGGDADPALDDDGLEADPADPEPDDRDEHQQEEDAGVAAADAPPAGPTTVTLPDGETVTAASPQLAAAIEAAVGGASIPDAFRQQGITIPAPGTAVASPIDPLQVGARRYRHLHRSPCAGPRPHQGTSGWPDSAHRHRERAELSRLGASAGRDDRDRAGHDRGTDPDPAGGHAEHWTIVNSPGRPAAQEQEKTDGKTNPCGARVTA